MKKLNVILATVAAFGLAACGGDKSQDASSASASAPKSITMNLAHNQNETHPVHLAIEMFAKEVADKTQGRIQIKVYPNAQLV